MTLRADAITPASPGLSHDLVVVVPGIMGSELTDQATGAVLWGLRDLGWYVRAWSNGSGLDALRLTGDELAGRYGRVAATGLLRFPAFARVFQGFEPYQRLVDAVRAAVVVPEAQVVEFAYDWRLPVAHNAGLLADRSIAALRAWRADPRHAVARRGHPDGREAKLVIVAHSMGGLLARHMSRDAGISAQVRATVTLGTPFYGSVKAASLLNAGRGAPLPLPARRPLRRLFQADADEGVRRMASTLPGLHDLLPTYRCVDDGPPGRRLTEADAVGFGADPDLTAQSARLHRDLAGVALPGHRCLVGTFQPTMQSLAITDGVVETHPGLWVDADAGTARWIDEGGDGTVYRGSATLGSAGPAHSYLPQQHGALARTDEAGTFVRAVITEQDPDRLGPPLAAQELGLDLPDLVLPGVEFTATIKGVARPRDATCVITDPGRGLVVDQPRVELRDGLWSAPITIERPGLYRIEVAGGGYSPVRQLVLVVDPTLAADGGAA